MNLKVQEATPFFLREAEMNAICRDYGRKGSLRSISPIKHEPRARRWEESYGRNHRLWSFSPILLEHGLWAKSSFGVNFAHKTWA